MQRTARRQLEALHPGSEARCEVEISVELSYNVKASVHAYVDAHDIDLLVLGSHGRTGVRRLLLGTLTEALIRSAEVPVLTVGERVPWESSREDLDVSRIVVPVDFSSGSKAALRAAKSLAAFYEAGLDLLFVAEERAVPQFSDTGLPTMGVLRMDPDIVAHADQALLQFAQHVGGPDVAAQAHVATGRVAPTITDFAEDRRADLLVIATRGLSGLDRVLLGSVTERVIRAAPCPTLVVRPGPDDDDDDNNGPTRDDAPEDRPEPAPDEPGEDA
jgi:nucleotide-binding universal stress UspA family protein